MDELNIIEKTAKNIQKNMFHFKIWEFVSTSPVNKINADKITNTILNNPQEFKYWYCTLFKLIRNFVCHCNELDALDIFDSNISEEFRKLVNAILNALS